MSDLSGRIEGLSPEKRELLELLLKQKTAEPVEEVSVPRRPVPSPCPLSFAQERLWFLDLFEPNTSVYNISTTVHLRGALDRSALQQTLDALVARHETLRTTFCSVEGVPEQVIAPEASVSLEIVDFSREPQGVDSPEVRRRIRQGAQHVFDLAHDLMLRATLYQLGPQEQILQLVMHHIASDGWSMGVLLREFTELYSAFSRGEQPSLPDPPIQYADYAIWQRKWLQGQVLARQLDYWKKQLADVSVLELPTDHPRPPSQTYRGASERIALSAELSAELQRFSRREGTSLFMTLMAAFQALLHRHSGQDDIAVGSPIANRSRVETEGLIGFFVNTLVLRTNLSGNPSFRDLLKQVRGTALDAYDHQDVPFEKLVEVLQPERSLSHTPLFQVMFVLQNAPGGKFALPGLRVASVGSKRQTTKFDLSLSLQPGRDRISGSLTYRTDLFEAATIRRMLGHFQALLEAVVDNPDRRISEIPILTAPERQQLLGEWNDTRSDYPRGCLQELFEAQVEKTPQAAAVVFEDQTMSYRELNRRANRLAHYLRERGVGPEAVVGLCLERSVDLLVGLLGILKAGGAYLPLDLHSPPERLGWMLEDAQARLLLTQQRLREQLPPQGVEIVSLDGDWQQISRRSGENPPLVTTEQSLAYVIYTSGSTGRPKGVGVEQRSLVNYLCWTNECLLQDLGGAWLPLLTTLTFDACLKQLYAPLLRGEAVWVLPPEMETQPEVLLETLSKREAVALNCVPSLWTILLEEVEAGRHEAFRRCLTHLYLGGEDFTAELLERTQAVFPRTRIWNLYGPTEATANATAAELVSGDRVTIGRPVANTQIYVLDRHLNPAPVGVPGELHIAGAGLARGYLNQPELTAEKFIPNPFSEDPQAKLYKSGDLARYLPDGRIQFLGRLDRQVKIRGLRIELGEIEAALTEHPEVKTAAVVVWEGEHRDKRLVAYVVSESGQAPGSEQLRLFLRARLPGYMLPWRFVSLDALPLTSNGKVDRRALPSPESTHPETGDAFEGPETAMEVLVAEIWQELLDLEEVGVHDNFFDLGGHSLLSVRAIAKIERKTGVRIRPRDMIFQTVRQIAAQCEEKAVAPAGTAPPGRFKKLSRAILGAVFRRAD